MTEPLLNRTNANSLVVDMVELKTSERLFAGDMTNDRYHVNIVTGKNRKPYDWGEQRYDSVSGSIPPRVPKPSHLGRYNDFVRWRPLDYVKSRHDNLIQIVSKFRF